MTGRSNDADLPVQLRDLSAVAQNLAEPVKSALQATLSAAPQDATPEQVLADTFGQLGYLPEEAERSASKVLAAARQRS